MDRVDGREILDIVGDRAFEGGAQCLQHRIVSQQQIAVGLGATAQRLIEGVGVGDVQCPQPVGEGGKVQSADVDHRDGARIIQPVGPPVTDHAPCRRQMRPERAVVMDGHHLLPVARRLGKLAGAQQEPQPGQFKIGVARIRYPGE